MRGSEWWTKVFTWLSAPDLAPGPHSLSIELIRALSGLQRKVLWAKKHPEHQNWTILPDWDWTQPQRATEVRTEVIHSSCDQDCDSGDEKTERENRTSSAWRDRISSRYSVNWGFIWTEREETVETNQHCSGGFDLDQVQFEWSKFHVELTRRLSSSEFSQTKKFEFRQCAEVFFCLVKKIGYFMSLLCLLIKLKSWESLWNMKLLPARCSSPSWNYGCFCIWLSASFHVSRRRGRWWGSIHTAGYFQRHLEDFADISRWQNYVLFSQDLFTGSLTISICNCAD